MASNVSKTQQNEGNLAPDRSYGKVVLTNDERKQLDMLGTILSNYSVDGDLPKAYEVISLTLHYQGKAERKGYRHLLPYLERLAANGLSVAQIADVLGMSASLLADAAHYYPEINAAIVGGRARGVNEAATTITTNAKSGDTAAAKFKLQTTGGFTTKAQVIQVQTNIGQAEAPVKSDTLNALKDRQKSIIEEVDFEELESS
jgi:hypothetical protein